MRRRMCVIPTSICASTPIGLLPPIDPCARFEGVVLVRPSRPAEFRYGDRVRVTGELSTPPEFATFNYADFLARQGVYSLIDRPRVSVLEHDQGNPILSAIYAFRDQAYAVIQQILPEPQASLLSGIPLGIDAGLPAEVQEDFRVTGTSHVIAISGQILTQPRLLLPRASFPLLLFLGREAPAGVLSVT